jgi:hypothetical protein
LNAGISSPHRRLVYCQKLAVIETQLKDAEELLKKKEQLEAQSNSKEAKRRYELRRT